MNKYIKEEKDILSSTVALQYSQERLRVMNTDTGIEIMKNINDLTRLLEAYQKGIIKEKK